MAIASRLRSALRNLFLRDHVDRQLDEELRAYVEMRVDELRAGGVSEREARRRVHMELGGLDQTKERTRDVRAGAFVDQVRRDVIHATRLLRARPGFTIVAIATLALGIGMNAALFSVFDTVVLRPLAYHDADRLYVVHEAPPGGTGRRTPVNTLHYREWRRASTSFQELALVGAAAYTLAGTGGAGDAERMPAGRATPNLFRTLGIRPMLGRAFLDEEDATGRDNVIILGYDLWATRFAADRSIIGRTVHVDDVPHEVVGVLPKGAELVRLSHYYDIPTVFEQPRFWKPFAATPRDLRPLSSFNYLAIGRLKAGVSASQAQDELNAIQAQLARQAPEPVQWGAALVPLADQMTGRSRAPLQLALAAVALVLLIACVNVTNLLLARGGERQREIAIRTATGATRARLVLQMLVEGLVLSGIAGAIGMLGAAMIVGALRVSAPIDLPRLDQVSLGPRGLLFTFAITVASGLLIGILPAVRSTRAAPVDLLRSASTTAAGSSGAGRLRAVLVSSEVAASTICLIVGALLTTSFIKLMSVERGFDTECLIATNVFLPPARFTEPAKARGFLQQVRDRAGAWPGVIAVGATDRLPFTGASTSAVMIEGSTLPRQQRPGAFILSADASYLQTLGVPLRAGRLLTDADYGRLVAVISTGTAQRLWPGQNPIGKRYRSGPDDSPFKEVVGVVGDVRGVSLTQEPPFNIYVPLSEPLGVVSLLLRTSPEADTTALSTAMRELIRDLDPTLTAPTVRTMNDMVASSVSAHRFQMQLVLLLGATALLLAVLGIYGVVSQTVAQRTSEFGVRIALGADGGRIRRLVLAQALRPVIAGIIVGALGALALGGLLRTLLFGVSPTAITPIAIASLFLFAVALLAGLIPAWRASRIDPLRALRYE